MMPYPWFNFAVALAIGLLIGLERERGKGEGPTQRPAGIRTFALAALLGAIATLLGGALLLGISTGCVAALAALSYFRSQDPDRGLTTEIGLVAAPLLGGLAMSDALLASGLGALVAVIFASKVPLHGFARSVLTASEVRDGLVLAVATLVIWPLLPNRYIGPLQALNPHNIWLLVVLVLALGVCGHVATRALGSRFGLPIVGFASGFISSTATIVSMAGRAIKDPASLQAAVAGAAFSTVSTFVQMALLLFTISQPTFARMAPALTAGGFAMGIYGLVFALRGLKADDTEPSEPGRMFSIGTALGLAAMMAVMMVVAAGLNDWLGESGVTIGAAVAGFVDTHSAAMSVASLAASAKLTALEGVPPILAAMTTNALAKVVMAAGVGSTAFAMRIIPGLVLSLVAAWAVAVPMILG
jgi:uncharacterized membrane protein (DUF4010 family)